MVTRLRCWNHTINAMKGWLKKHGATNSEVPAYVSHLRELLNSTSKESYEANIKELSKTWSKAFHEYFYKEIDPDV